MALCCGFHMYHHVHEGRGTLATNGLKVIFMSRGKHLDLENAP